MDMDEGGKKRKEKKKKERKKNVPSLGVGQRGGGIRSRSLEIDDEVTQGRIRLSILEKLPREIGTHFPIAAINLAT